jgi:hypothetical protein
MQSPLPLPLLDKILRASTRDQCDPVNEMTLLPLLPDRLSVTACQSTLEMGRPAHSSMSAYPWVQLWADGLRASVYLLGDPELSRSPLGGLRAASGPWSLFLSLVKLKYWGERRDRTPTSPPQPTPLTAGPQGSSRECKCPKASWRISFPKSRLCTQSQLRSFNIKSKIQIPHRGDWVAKYWCQLTNCCLVLFILCGSNGEEEKVS